MPNIIIWLQDKMCFIIMSNNQLDMFMNVTGHIMKICLVICYKNHAGPPIRVNYAHKYHLKCQHRCQLMRTPNADMHHETARKYVPVDFNHFLLPNLKLCTFIYKYKRVVCVGRDMYPID